ncbi:MAG: hypothetical protein Q4G39_07820, partial [Brachymonas sp.]|nr:hypothetical protein [Brachymonas sp.]
MHAYPSRRLTQLTLLALVAFAAWSTVPTPVEAAPKRRVVRKAPRKPVAKKATTAAPTGKAARGDYVVAIVNNDPVTNFEVNHHANDMAREMAANGGQTPA